MCGVEVWRGGLGLAYRLPTLSSVGASLAPPCFRFHTPLIEPDVRICRIRLSEKTQAIALEPLPVTPSATPENKKRELKGFSPISRSFVASCVRLQLRPLPSTGITRLHRYCEPLRHPSRPSLSLTSFQLIRTAISAGPSRVSHGPLCLHAVANTPAGLMEFVRSYDSTNFGLPRNRGGSAPALVFSRPAQRLLTLRPARSPSRLATLCTRGFSSLVSSTASLICYRVERTSSRAGLPPLWTTAFSRRTRLSDLPKVAA